MAFTSQVDLTAVSTSSNVLNHFRSYNYLFTLSSLPKTAFAQSITPNQVSALADRYVIAKSAGKKIAGIQLPSTFNNDVGPPIQNDWNTERLVEKFNTESAGRFNFYFDNLEIESVVAFDKRTGFSKSSKLTFTIVEPYSLAGLLEALQVSAVAAGYPTYKSAPFILKIEFKGYPDWNDGGPVSVDQATRYYIIRFGEMNVQADEQGTKYTCTAAPANELAFGEPNKLKTNINIQGNTVREILQYFAQQLTLTSKENNESSSSSETEVNTDIGDTYEILFPSVDPKTGIIDYDTASEEIGGKQVANLSVDNVPWAFIDPVTHQETTTALLAKGVKTFTYTPTTVSSQFSSNANVHDCISAIVRDSEYGVSLVKDIESRRDDTDHVPYFNIIAEAVPSTAWDKAAARIFYKYRYYVVPYKIHISKVPGYENGTYDMNKLRKTVRRHYKYLYTGQNVDVLGFNLKFDNLYFQNQPLREGNQNFTNNGGKLDKGTITQTVTGTTTSADAANSSGTNVNERQVNTRSVETGHGGEGTRPLQDNPYDTMVKNLHDTILDNVGMMELEIEIIGDPLYLVQNGTGNLRVTGNPQYPGLTSTGDIDSQIAPVYVEVTFRNPIDIDSTTGLMKFGEVTSFSGIYKVITAISKFSGGLFTQRLTMVRIPGQPSDTKKATVFPAIFIGSTPPTFDSDYYEINGVDGLA